VISTNNVSVESISPGLDVEPGTEAMASNEAIRSKIEQVLKMAPCTCDMSTALFTVLSATVCLDENEWIELMSTQMTETNMRIFHDTNKGVAERLKLDTDQLCWILNAISEAQTNALASSRAVKDHANVSLRPRSASDALRVLSNECEAFFKTHRQWALTLSDVLDALSEWRGLPSSQVLLQRQINQLSIVFCLHVGENADVCTQFLGNVTPTEARRLFECKATLDDADRNVDDLMCALQMLCKAANSILPLIGL
jgi:hypothetical protein